MSNERELLGSPRTVDVALEANAAWMGVLCSLSLIASHAVVTAIRTSLIVN